jgi:hypothetical protein
MSLIRADNTLSQRYSVWKTLAIEVLVLALATLPLTPGFSRGLVHGAFLYRWPYSLILYSSCGIMGIGFILLLPIFWRAVFQLPGIVISKDRVTVYGIIARSVKTCEVTKVSPVVYGSVTINAPNRSVTVPAFLYEDPGRVLAKLREFFPKL